MRVFQCRKEKCCTSDGSVIACAAAVGGISFQNDMRCQALRCLTLRKFSSSKIDVPLLYRIIRHLSTPLYALFRSDIHPIFRYMHHLRVLQDVKTIETVWKSYILQKANVINPHSCFFLLRTELRLFIFEIQNDSAFLLPGSARDFCKPPKHAFFSALRRIQKRPPRFQIEAASFQRCTGA